MKRYFRILSYGRPFAKNGVLAVVFVILTNVFNVFSIALVIPFLKILFDNKSGNEAAGAASNGGKFAGIYEWLAEQVAHFGEIKVLGFVCIMLVVTTTLKSLFRYLTTYNATPFEMGTVENIRNTLFGHLKKLSLSFYSGNRKGDIINVMVTDVEVVQLAVVGTFLSLFSNPISMLFVLGTLFVLSWKLTLFSLILLPLAALILNLISKTLKRQARIGQEKMGLLISVLDEFIGGIRIVKGFGAEEFEEDKYKKHNREYTRRMNKFRRRADLASPVNEVFAVIVISIIIVYGGSLILGDASDLRPEEFIGFVAFFSQFIAPIKTFSGAISKMQKGVASFTRIEDFLAIEEEVTEKPSAKPVTGFEKEIVYKDVFFSYEHEFVLNGIDIEIRKDETIAFVGPSGGGKSTMADLLPRYYDPTEGAILLDGTDLRELKVDDLRNLFGIVTQEGILFNDTLIANIAYGDPSPDLNKVAEAARVAEIHQFIMGLPRKYHSIIGERGTKLSGGQRQRIAIARAIYKDPDILILDEATSALDSETEKLVQKALDNLMANRTSVVIAHRLSTIQKADRIYVIDHGRVIESGNHAELLALNGLYKRLHEIQFSD